MELSRLFDSEEQDDTYAEHVILSARDFVA